MKNLKMKEYFIFAIVLLVYACSANNMPKNKSHKNKSQTNTFASLLNEKVVFQKTKNQKETN